MMSGQRFHITHNPLSCHAMWCLIPCLLLAAVFIADSSTGSPTQLPHQPQIARQSSPNESQTAEQLVQNDIQTSECQYPQLSQIEPSCWDTLDMTQYTYNWWANNARLCNTPSNFSACFWDRHGLSSIDCTGIQPSTCIFPTNTNFTTQDYYIAYNIFGINQVFNSYWQGMENANAIAVESIGAIVQLLDPPKKTNVHLNDVLLALGTSLQFLNVVSLAGLVKGIVIANQQSPQVFKNLVPVGTTQTQIAQMVDLSSSLGGIVQQYQQNIADSIPLIVNDVETFVNFASTGQFQVNPLPNIAVASDQLLTGLQTFIVSRALTANNAIITRANNTNIADLAAGPNNDLSYTTGCESGYDSNNFCGSFWYDNTTNTTYALDSLQNMNDDFSSIREQIFSNWTTPESLYRGAAECHDLGGSNGQLDQFLILGNTINTACLSNTQVCTWDLTSLDEDHEFADCPSQTGYIANGCTGEDDGVNVPNGYIGPYLTDAPDLDQVCNS